MTRLSGSKHVVILEQQYSNLSLLADIITAVLRRFYLHMCIDYYVILYETTMQ